MGNIVGANYDTEWFLKMHVARVVQMVGDGERHGLANVVFCKYDWSWHFDGKLADGSSRNGRKATGRKRNNGAFTKEAPFLRTTTTKKKLPSTRVLIDYKDLLYTKIEPITLLQ
jgi:hypothetical protein